MRGGLLAGLLFVVPGAIVMLALSLLYDAGRGLAVVDGIFLGIKAAVLAIVAEALHRIAGRALKSRTLALMAVATFVAIVALRVPFPYIIAAAAQSGLSAAKSCRRRSAGTVRDVSRRAAPPRRAPAPGGGPGTRSPGRSRWRWRRWRSARPILVDLGLFFSKLAVVTFGGAYAVLAYLADAAVGAKGWVTTAEMVDGLGETTPEAYDSRQPVRRVPGRHPGSRSRRSRLACSGRS